MNKLDLFKMMDIADVTSAKRIFARDYVTSGIPFYRGKEITELHGGALNVSTDLFITAEKFSEIKKKHGAPEEGDILLTSVGTLGSVYLVKPGDKFYFKDGNVTWFRNLAGVMGAYLRYWLISPEGRAQLQKCIIGSSQSAYTIENLKRMEIRLPPLETQHRIAAILGAYDDLIEVNRRRIEVLEEMARGLFEEWFVRFRFPGHETVPILDTPNGPLPEGWRQATVSEAFELLRGRSYRSAELTDEGGMPFINLKCMERDGGFRVSGIKRFTGDFKPNHAVVRGDIVLAVTDMTQERRIVGRAARIPLLDEPEAVISMDLVKVRPRDGIDQSFLYCWLRYSDFGVKAAQHANGANVLHLSPKAVLDLPFVSPPSHLQAEFGRTVEPFFVLAEVLAVSERRLSASRDLLLPRLISGQLSVAEAERQLEEAA